MQRCCFSLRRRKPISLQPLRCLRSSLPHPAAPEYPKMVWAGCTRFSSSASLRVVAHTSWCGGGGLLPAHAPYDDCDVEFVFFISWFNDAQLFVRSEEGDDLNSVQIPAESEAQNALSTLGFPYRGVWRKCGLMKQPQQCMYEQMRWCSSKTIGLRFSSNGLCSNEQNSESKRWVVEVPKQQPECPNQITDQKKGMI